MSTSGPISAARSSGSPGEKPDGIVTDARFMEIALDEARAAARADEVPIGACLVRDGAVVARGRNRTRERGDPRAHAEMLVLDDAIRTLWDERRSDVRPTPERSSEVRLLGATLYCTVEPCCMCAGALVHARVDRVVFGVRDPKFGGCVSLASVLSDPRANHRARLEEGVLAESARELLQEFFRGKRR